MWCGAGEPRQVIHVPGAHDLCSICVSSPCVYVADALGRRLLRFELLGAAVSELRATPCRASWGSKKISGESRWEKSQKMKVAIDNGDACAIQ